MSKPKVEEPVTPERARELVAEFLVNRPLYSPLRFTLGTEVQLPTHFYPNALRRRCSACKDSTNWTARSHGPDARGGLGEHEGGHLLSYRCVQCSKTIFAIWVLYSCVDEARKEVPMPGNARAVAVLGNFGTIFEHRKAGQWEPWSIQPDAALEAAMRPEDYELYKRGLMNMSTGYGIGAVAYFRRVVENETERLLGALEGVAKEENDEPTLAMLATARRGHNADERLRLAAEATPAWLRLGGLNPLKSMYANFSVAIHQLDDDACIEIATKLRASFEYVFRTIRQHEQARAELARALS